MATACLNQVQVASAYPAQVVLGRLDQAAAASLNHLLGQPLGGRLLGHLLVVLVVGTPPSSYLQGVAASLLLAALPHVDLAPSWALQAVVGSH